MNNPVEAARTLQETLRKLEKGFHSELYDVLATVSDIAETFLHDKAAYRTFIDDPFWEKCKLSKPKPKDDHNRVILWVSRFVFKAANTKGSRYNRAYKHARTLQRFAREEIPVSDVASKLKQEGGSDYAFQLETKEHPRTVKGASRTKGEKQTAVSARGASKHEKVPMSPDGEPALVVESTPERLNRVLGLEVGQTARFTVTRREGDGDWKRIVATKVTVGTN